MSWKLCTLADAFLIFQFECKKINFTLFRDYLCYLGVWSDNGAGVQHLRCFFFRNWMFCWKYIWLWGGASCQNKLSNLVGGSVCIIGFYYPGEILWPLSLAHGWKEERELAKTLVFSIYSHICLPHYNIFVRCDRTYLSKLPEYILFWFIRYSCFNILDMFVWMCWIYSFEHVGYISLEMSDIFVWICWIYLWRHIVWGGSDCEIALILCQAENEIFSVLSYNKFSVLSCYNFEGNNSKYNILQKLSAP